MEIAYEKLYFDENCIFHFQEFIQPRYTSPFHSHDEYELIFIKKSHGKLYVGNNVLNFTDGDLFLFAPGLPHCFFNTSGYEMKDIAAHAIVIWFKKDFLGDNFFNKREASQLVRLLEKSKYGIQFFSPKESILKKFQRLNQKRNLKRLGDFLIILDELATKRNIKLLSPENTLKLFDLNDSMIITNVYKYVAENFQKQISFDVAASVANMQRSAFCRYFKRKTKKKFSEFVNETRIMHARKLLAESDKTIIEIAFECGYENTSYFNRQFKIYCDNTPTYFRDQYTNIK
jgi:AraC-like DNA-binding protein